MAANYMLVVLNVLIAGLPVWSTYEFPGYLVYLGLAVLFLALLCWNRAGEFLVVRLVFRAKPLPSDALIAPPVQKYLSSAAIRRTMLEENCAVYYANSRIPYFMPVSKQSVVISLALENHLIADGTKILERGVCQEAYVPQYVFSRRLLLLAILIDVIMIRLVELWTVFFAFMAKAICAIAMVIATGAIFEGPKELYNAISWGKVMGLLAVKINDWFNYIQDKFIEWLMKTTKANSFSFLKEESRVQISQR